MRTAYHGLKSQTLNSVNISLQKTLILTKKHINVNLKLFYGFSKLSLGLRIRSPSLKLSSSRPSGIKKLLRRRQFLVNKALVLAKKLANNTSGRWRGVSNGLRVAQRYSTVTHVLSLKVRTGTHCSERRAVLLPHRFYGARP